jgi:hypothetical protein
MQEVFRTQDIVEVSLVKSILDSAGIKYFVFGEQLNSVLGDLIGDDISAARFMVLEQDVDEALDILEDAGLFDDEDDDEPVNDNDDEEDE